MGNILNIFKKGKEFRLLMQGLDAAGKTTILYQLKLGEVVTTIPTIGFNVETVEFKNLKLTVWDVGSRDKMRPLYRHYYPGTQGLIFVIDSNDIERIYEAKYEIDRTLNEDELRDTKVLFIANKQDLQNAMSVAEITEKLELHKIKHQCNVFGACATTGDGLEEALGWLADVLNSKDTPQVEGTNNLKNNGGGNVCYFQKGVEAIKKLFTS